MKKKEDQSEHQHLTKKKEHQSERLTKKKEDQSEHQHLTKKKTKLYTST